MEPLTTLEFVSALRKAGFVLTAVTDQRIAMTWAGRHVVVRRHQMLTPDQLSVLLLAAGLTHAELEKLIQRPLPRASGVVLRAHTNADDDAPESGTD